MFLKTNVVRLSKSGKSIVIRSTPEVPYARAVDEGKRAVTIRAKNTEFLMFGRKGGKPIFRKQVHIPRQKGQNFVEKAVMKWLEKRKIGERLKVRWEDSRKHGK